ncbi:MAG: hypothetical protein C4334_05410 [Pyrinomonas sp.]
MMLGQYSKSPPFCHHPSAIHGVARFALQREFPPVAMKTDFECKRFSPAQRWLNGECVFADEANAFRLQNED